MASVELRAGAERPVSAGGGVHSRHGLSFGAHYDPARTAFGALVAHNDDHLEPGVAYGPHDHRDVEILAWVLSGSLVHVGPTGTEDVAPAGTLQHLVAGTGWHHDERAGPEGVHVLQIWIAPGLDDPPPGEPSLTHLTPAPPYVHPLRRAGATLALDRLAPGERWRAPDGSHRHVHVTRGALGDAAPGDTLEITGPGPVDLTAGPDGADLVVVTTA